MIPVNFKFGLKKLNQIGQESVKLKSLFGLKPLAPVEEEETVKDWYWTAGLYESGLFDCKVLRDFNGQLYASEWGSNYFYIVNPDNPDDYDVTFIPDWTEGDSDVDVDAMLSDDNYLYAFFYRKPSGWATKYLYRYDGTTWTKLAEFVVGNYNRYTAGMVELDGFFYIGFLQTLSSSSGFPVQIWKVDKSDGTATLEFEVDGNRYDKLRPFIFNNELYAFYLEGGGVGDYTFSIYKRDEVGDWSQVWTDESANYNIWYDAVIEFNGALWWGGNNYRIWKFDGTTVTEFDYSSIMPAPESPVTLPSQIYSMSIFQNKLFMAGWDGAILAYNPALDDPDEIEQLAEAWSISYPHIFNNEDEKVGWFYGITDMKIFQDIIYATGDAYDWVNPTETIIKHDFVEAQYKLLGYEDVP
jgi:hypothetical protein